MTYVLSNHRQKKHEKFPQNFSGKNSISLYLVTIIYVLWFLRKCVVWRIYERNSNDNIWEGSVQLSYIQWAQHSSSFINICLEKFVGSAN